MSSSFVVEPGPSVPFYRNDERAGEKSTVDL